MSFTNRYNILRVKFRGLKSKWRLFYLVHFRGLKIGKNGRVGKLYCDWPNKIHIGDNCILADGNYFWFKYPFDDSNYMELGDYTHIGRNCTFNINTTIITGKHCMIADYAQFADINHGIAKGATVNSQEISVSPILLGDDVWLGVGCIVLKGVHLADGVIVAAGSFVNKSIPANEIWGGIPARKIGERK